MFMYSGGRVGTEQRQLPRPAFGMDPFPLFHGVFHGGMDLPSLGAESIQCPCVRQLIDDGLVDQFWLDPRGEIKQRFEGSVRLPLGDDGFDGAFSDSLQCNESVDDAVPLEGEVARRFVDMGWNHFYSQSATFF